jgi:hypothetical protein
VGGVHLSDLIEAWFVNMDAKTRKERGETGEHTPHHITSHKKYTPKKQSHNRKVGVEAERK